MKTNTTGGPHDRAQPVAAPAETPAVPACATGKDIIAQTLVRHWPLPYVMDGNAMWVRCGDEECGFQSSRAALVGEEGAWAEHAYHVADLLELAGIGELNPRTSDAGTAATDTASRFSEVLTRVEVSNGRSLAYFRSKLTSSSPSGETAAFTPLLSTAEGHEISARLAQLVGRRVLVGFRVEDIGPAGKRRVICDIEPVD